MAGCFGSHPEDRARERELNRYLDAQDAAENRERAIAEAAEELMKPGKECDPFGIERRTYGQVSGVFRSFHLEEAITESEDVTKLALTEAFQKAERTKLHSDYAEAGVQLMAAVNAYWRKQAKAVAERRME